MNNKKLKLNANAVGVAILGDPHFGENTLESPTAYTNSKSKIKTLTSDNKGITLIALIITIIVMLILVAVTVTVAINGGLFSTAKQATTDTQYHADREMLLSAVIGAINKDAEVDFEKLDANLPNGFTGTQGEYTSEAGNTFYVDKNGNITDEKVEEAEKPATVAELKAGKYVNYIDNEGKTIKSIVLYDEAYNNEHGTDYGIQIITADVVDEMEITLTEENWEHPETLLYEKAQSYLNTSFASVARCVGSDPSNPSHMDSSWGSLKENDSGELEPTYYYRETADFSQLSVISAVTTSSDYLLFLSYWYQNSPDDYAFSIEAVGDGCVYDIAFFNNIVTDWPGWSESISCGFRPCFKLKSEIKIASGNGTSDDPYQLEIPE